MYEWRKNGEYSLLSRINLKEVKGIFSKSIIINPGEAAFRRKNGISEPVKTQGMLKIMNFWDLLLSPFKKGRIQAFIIDISPFDVDMHIMDDTLKTGTVKNRGGDAEEQSLVEQYIIGGTLITKDQQTVGLSLRINVSVNVEQIDMFINIIRGRNNITTSHIWARIDQLIHQKILSPLIEVNTFDEIKGKDVRKLIEKSAEPELGVILNGYGLLLHNISARWHITKKEFVKNLPVDLDQLMYQKVSFDGEEFDFTYGEFFNWLGVILVIFIIGIVIVFLI